MVPKNLVRQIENHSDALFREVLRRIKADTRVCAYWALPESELSEAVGEVFGQLGSWLTVRTDSAIASRYRRIGGQRFHQKIPLSQLLCAFVIVKSTLIDFIRGSILGGPEERRFEQEFLLSVSEFFDKAMCGAAAGYEDAFVAQQTAPMPAQSPYQSPRPSQKKQAEPASTEWDPTSRAGEAGEVSG